AGEGEDLEVRVGAFDVEAEMRLVGGIEHAGLRPLELGGRSLTACIKTVPSGASGTAVGILASAGCQKRSP
ncbi:hypothetical protein, partial [Metapseudomonas otitidis]|uniref:hypothetical protein n=1 Tax=Metapseudomonas otitidis TaxID=319939 RepID=UPI00244A7A63